MRSLASLVAPVGSLVASVIASACGASATPASTTPATGAPTGATTDATTDATTGETTGPTTAAPGDASTPSPTNAPAPDQVCAKRPDDFGPVLLTAAVAAARPGAGATTFASAPSSKDQPIEVCGVTGSRQWLMAAACTDGSHPLATAPAVMQSRAGNVGPGGRCHSIIDHYVVPCPEATYDVYVDMYMCGPGELF